MNAGKYMLGKEKLTTLDLEESVESALEKIEKGNFLSLPVLDNDEFKGYLMKESIYRNYFDYKCNSKDEYLKNVRVKDIFIDSYKAIGTEDLVEEASYLLKEFRTPFLPVFDKNDKFVGILTHTAIFDVFSQVIGLGQGTRLIVDLYDIPGQAATLTDIIRKQKINIINFAALDTKVLDVYKVILRVETKDDKELNRLVEKIESEGFKVSKIDK